MPAKRVPSTRALDRVVQDITGDHAAVADPHTHMPGGVSRPPTESYVASKRGVRCHGIDEPGVDPRLHGIGERGGVQTIFGGKGITNSTTRVIRTLPTFQVIVPKLPPTLAMF